MQMTFRASSNACDGLRDRPVLVADLLDISDLQTNTDIRTCKAITHLLPVQGTGLTSEFSTNNIVNCGVTPGMALIIGTSKAASVQTPSRHPHKTGKQRLESVPSLARMHRGLCTSTSAPLTLKVSLGVPYSAIFCICVVSSSPWLSTTKTLRELTL